MKRILKGAIASLLFFGVVQAGTHHDKTFLMPRSHNDNLAMQYTTGHKQVYKKGIEEDHFGGTLQLAPFYQRSTNTKALGNYFGTFYEYPYNSTPTFQELQDFIGVEYLADGYMPGTVPLNPLVLIHSHGHGTNPGAISNALRFRPYQESIGLRVDYNQKLDKLIPGLYLQIEAPLVYVKQSLGETLTSAATTQYLIGDNGVDDPTRSAVSLVDYLSGNVTNTATASSHGHEQEALTYAKINGSHNEFGLADVDLKLGYNFLYEDKKHVAIYTALTIPTGNKPDGRYVFEPMVGNGGHWAVGGGIDLSLELWKDEN
ncbi:hypothetical protein HON15_04535, partial [Candidatus Woesearchaeota archaeon]|nr:hypothetical protein [Candidatus Woesearchaeota archaeon]